MVNTTRWAAGLREPDTVNFALAFKEVGQKRELTPVAAKAVPLVSSRRERASSSFRQPEPIVLVIFNIKSARYLVLFAGKSTR